MFKVIRTFAPKALVLLLLGTTLISGAGLASAEQASQSAKETQAQADQNVDPRTAVVQALGHLQDVLGEDAIADMSEEKWGTAAQYVVNILEGEKGAHYDSSVTFDPGAQVTTDGYGVIPHLQDLTGRSADEFKVEQLQKMIEDGSESPELLSMAHLILVDSALTGSDAPVDSATLVSAGKHIQDALYLLTGDE